MHAAIEGYFYVIKVLCIKCNDFGYHRAVDESSNVSSILPNVLFLHHSCTILIVETIERIAACSLIAWREVCMSRQSK